MATSYHMHVDIRGSLKNRSYLNGGFKHPDGRKMTADEAFEALCDQLAKGRDVLPLGACDNFDFKTGCQGHTVEGASREAPSPDQPK